MIGAFSAFRNRKLKKTLRENFRIRASWFSGMKSQFARTSRLIAFNDWTATAIGTTFGGAVGFLLGTVGIVGLGAAFALPLLLPLAIVGGVFAYAANKLLLDFRKSEPQAAAIITDKNDRNLSEQSDYRFLSDNESHRDFMLEALKKSEIYVVIRSAFISSNVIDDAFLSAVKSALTRGVTVYLEWGYRVIVSRRNDNEISAVKALRDFTRSLEPNLRNRLKLTYSPTHVKEISVDDRFASSGSFNWLSNASFGKLRNKERSLVLFDERVAREISNDAKAAWKAWPFRFEKAAKSIEKG